MCSFLLCQEWHSFTCSTKKLANRIKMNRQYSQLVHCMCPHIPTQHTPAQRMFSVRGDLMKFSHEDGCLKTEVYNFFRASIN